MELAMARGSVTSTELATGRERGSDSEISKAPGSALCSVNAKALCSVNAKAPDSVTARASGLASARAPYSGRDSATCSSASWL